jgi:FkbM family methyltransferase
MDNNDLKNFEVLSKIIMVGDVLVDVGANYGDYTDFFKSKLNGTGIIYSIELHPETYNQLKSKFENDQNIKTFNYGVCDIDGEIEYFKGKDEWTNNIIGHDMSFTKNQSLGKIQGITLDSLLKNEKKIKLIKIDVEGAENRVLNGMKKIINYVENVLIECHLDEDWDEIKKILIGKLNLSCINIKDNIEVTDSSNRVYQCLCKKK